MDKEQTLYLDCQAGISGDMMVAALLDLGADEQVLMAALHSIPDQSFQIKISRVRKSAIDCCDFDVILDSEHENHDHDMAYLHGDDAFLHHDHTAPGHGDNVFSDHNHSAADDDALSHRHHVHTAPVHEEDALAHSHGTEQVQEEAPVHHHHAHRSFNEVKQILDETEMTPNARNIAGRIFQILAKAEAKAHAVPVEEVHFHEVGAIDSIVDVVAAAVCLDNLNITKAIIPVLCEGTGTVRTQHGVLFVPVPAVANIVSDSGLNLQITNVMGEFVTPTGAAIAAAIKTSDKLPEQFQIRKIGLGAGKRNYERPSILRAMLIRESAETGGHTGDSSREKKLSAETTSDSVAQGSEFHANDEDSIWKLETNLDDCSGEVLGYTMERLFAAGARDVFYTPIYMKKNRPGYLLSVLCTEEKIPAMEEIIFAETTTIGIRRVKMERTILAREMTSVQTSWGAAKIKVCRTKESVKFYPEYESVAGLARENGVPFAKVFQEALEKCRGIH